MCWLHSVRWTTPQGTTTIDQKTGAVSFGTPLLVYPLYEGDTWGAAWVPPAHVSGSVTFVATAAGAQLHFLRIERGKGRGEGRILAAVEERAKSD